MIYAGEYDSIFHLSMDGVALKFSLSHKLSKLNLSSAVGLWTSNSFLIKCSTFPAVNLSYDIYKSQVSVSTVMWQAGCEMWDILRYT